MRFIFILLFNFIINFLINYYNTLFNNRDYLFKFKFSIFFNKGEEIFAYIINSFIIFIQIRNIIEILIVFPRNIKFNTIIKYIINRYY